MGADIDTSISKKTNYVLIGEDPGPKKLETLDNLIHNGFNIKKIFQKDFDEIMNGYGDNYYTEREIEKDLDFTMEHYLRHHLTFDGMDNRIASKELFFGKGLKSRTHSFCQITGNLGAFGNWELSSEVNICILSNSTLEKLQQGIKDETIQYIQDYYNKNKSITFNFDFMSEQDILDWCKMRCDRVGDKVTMNLYYDYINS